MQYTLKQLRYFVAVAEHGSISVASKNLHISQPALSAAISQLESVIGLPLLIRHHARGVSITPAGRQFLSQVRGLLSHAEEIQHAGKDLGTSVSGTLIVGCFTTLAPFFIPQLLRTLEQAHPALSIELAEGALDHVQHQLIMGKSELALVYHIDLDPRLSSKPLTTVIPHAVLPVKHQLSSHSSVPLPALATEPMILLDLPHSRDYFYTLFRDLGIEPNIRYRTQSFELVRGLVGQGHGYSVLNLKPTSNETYDGGQVRYIPIENPTRDLVIALAHTKAITLTRRATAFIDTCEEFFSTL
ncbi:MAG: LysR family transcriptional regulator [Acidiferrobacteraceae bacterium]|nr:LysR family transcriptional regulator [Acidiferrobacteraceae bacterium]